MPAYFAKMVNDRYTKKEEYQFIYRHSSDTILKEWSDGLKPIKLSSSIYLINSYIPFEVSIYNLFE